MSTQHDYCIILAGGIGRRLWPCSRKTMPKQFIDFFGIGRTLLQQTYNRFASFIPHDHIFISTYKDYLPIVHEQLPDLPECNILAEPVQLSTAPAAVWASCHIGLTDPEANIIASPADHCIFNQENFVQQIKDGLEFVSKHEDFLAIGVKPTIPNTAYGYIQIGEGEEQTGLFRIKSFSEKPAQEYAKMFIESGEFLWNTGLFLWKAPTMLKCANANSAAINEMLSKTDRETTSAEELEHIKACYPSSMHHSLDLLILEKCNNTYVQQGNFGWADIGSWPELHKVSEKDADENAILSGSNVLLSGCKGNTVCLPKNIGAVINGLNGYLVAQEGNLLVICPNNDPALVRRLVNEAQIQLGDNFT